MLTFTDLLKRKYLDADLDRYCYNTGDIVNLSCGGQIVVQYSTIEYVVAYVTRRSLVLRSFGECKVSYDDLPYQYQPGILKVQKKIKWSVGDVVQDEDERLIYLDKEFRQQEFYGWVCSGPADVYLHAGIFLLNPHRDYVVCK